jgi:hypothetical protein
MSETDDLEFVPFGQLPFDLFVMVRCQRPVVRLGPFRPTCIKMNLNNFQDRWDASSALSKKEQKEALVTEWIELGQQGRKVRTKSYTLSILQTAWF